MLTGFVILLLLAAEDVPLTPAPEPSAADRALMETLRREVEALPADQRVALGVQMLKDRVDEFQDAGLRARVYLSLGELYQQLGETKLSKQYFELAGMGEDGDLSAISRQHLLDATARDGGAAPVVAKALELRTRPDLTDVEYAELTQRAAMALLQQGDRSGAVDLAIAAATERPCLRAYSMVLGVSLDASAERDKRDMLRGIRWLADFATEDFGDSPSFMSHWAYAEEFAGELPASLEVRKRIVELYPGQETTGQNIMEISRLCWSLNQPETAREYLTRLVEGEYSEALRERGRQGLESLRLQDEGHQRHVPIEPADVKSSRGNMTTILAMNLGVIALLIGGAWLYRRRGTSA